MTILLAGIDTLELGLHISDCQLDDMALDHLNTDKLIASYTKERYTRSEIYGKEMMIYPSGGNRYTYHLFNDDISLEMRMPVQEGMYYPDYHIKFSQAYLWRRGQYRAIEDVLNWLKAFNTITFVQLSRVDLCADLDRRLPVLPHDYNTIVTKARTTGEHAAKYSRNHRITGYQFGKGDMVCRFYDKVLDNKLKNKQWFEEHWRKNGWAGDTPVTRFEYEMKRDILRGAEFNTLEQLQRGTAPLWNYCMKWLSERIPVGTESNKERWNLSPTWLELSEAKNLMDGTGTITRINQAIPQLDHILTMAKGYAVSAEALTGFQVDEWLAMIKSTPDYRKAVLDRRVKLGIVELSTSERV